MTATAPPPPGGHLAAWIEPPVRLHWLGRVAIAALALAVPATLFDAIVSLNYASTVDGLSDGSASVGDFQNAQDLVEVTEVIGGVAVLVATVFFIAWFYRAYRNLTRLSVAQLRFRSGWAIGAWFVPVLNLVMPKQIANDIWRASSPAADVTTSAWRSLRVSTLIHAWWLLWLTAVAVAIAAAAVHGWDADDVLVTASDFNDETLAYTLSAIADLASIAALVGSILVVRDLTRRQDALIAATPTAPRPGTTPAAPPVAPSPAKPRTPSPWAPGGVPAAPPRATSQAASNQTGMTAAVGRSWECALCGWRFGSVESAERHVLTHHGERVPAPHVRRVEDR